MQQKLKQKFILIAMIALSCVLLVIFTSFNMANYLTMIKKQDTLLKAIAADNAPIPANFPNDFLEANTSEFSVRYFTVTTNAKGTITNTSINKITAHSKNNLITYVKSILARKNSFGYYKNYRYHQYKDGNKTMITFLDCQNERAFMRMSLFISLLVSFFSFWLMFMLVFILSKKAIAPFVKNLDMQKRFITDAGHELKTPLTAIATSADVLAFDVKENEWISTIQNQSVKLSKLIADLILLSKLDEETPLPEKNYFLLARLFGKPLSLLFHKQKLPEKNLITHVRKIYCYMVINSQFSK